MSLSLQCLCFILPFSFCVYECLPARVSDYMCPWWPRRPGEGIGSPGSGVAESCSLLCGCWVWELFLWKSSRCSELWSLLPRPYQFLLQNVLCTVSCNYLLTTKTIEIVLWDYWFPGSQHTVENLVSVFQVEQKYKDRYAALYFSFANIIVSLWVWFLHIFCFSTSALKDHHTETLLSKLLVLLPVKEMKAYSGSLFFCPFETVLANVPVEYVFILIEHTH